MKEDRYIPPPMQYQPQPQPPQPIHVHVTLPPPGQGGQAPPPQGQPWPAQQRPYAGVQLGEREGFRQIVVGAAVEAADPVLNAAPRREHEDRHGHAGRADADILRAGVSGNSSAQNGPADDA